MRRAAADATLTPWSLTLPNPLGRPFSIAAGPTGIVSVADTDLPDQCPSLSVPGVRDVQPACGDALMWVRALSDQGAQTAEWADSPFDNTRGPFRGIGAVGVGQDGSMYLAASHCGYRFAPDGQPVLWPVKVQTICHNGAVYGPTIRAGGFAVGTDGTVYATDREDNTVWRIAPDLSVTTWGETARAPGHLYLVNAIVADAQGNLYLSLQYWRPEVPVVQKRSATGQELTDFAIRRGVSPDGRTDMSGPGLIALDREGRVYLGSGGLVTHVGMVSRITRYGADGQLQGVWGTLAPGNEAIDAPWSLAVDAAGFMYVGGESKIQKISPDGQIVLSVDTSSWDGSAGTGHAMLTGLAVDAKGTIFARAFDADRILVLNPDWTLAATLMLQQSGVGRAVAARLAVDRAGTRHTARTVCRAAQHRR